MTAKLVGDVGDGAPEHWVGGLSDPARAHVLVSVWAAGSADAVEEVSALLRAGLHGTLEEVGALDANALPGKNISGQDVLLGVNDPASSSFTLPAPDGNRRLTGFGAFTTTRGGAYCYLPSISALRHLAAGAVSGS